MVFGGGPFVATDGSSRKRLSIGVTTDLADTFLKVLSFHVVEQSTTDRPSVRTTWLQRAFNTFLQGNRVACSQGKLG
jgi:hypothetical protein